MDCKRITDPDRDLINAFIKEHWFTTTMIIRGREIDMTRVEGFYFSEGHSVTGLLTYMVYDHILEITSLDSIRENQGTGSRLLEAVRQEARDRGCQKIVLITTNDNIHAIRFYQKRGFDMVRLFHNSIEASRKLKPEIPLIGDNDIPLRHEIEFEMDVPAPDPDPSFIVLNPSIPPC